MRVLRRNENTGELKLLLQNLDDLWHLYNVLEEGDLVRAKTYRREEPARDMLRAARPEKKRMTLGVRAERVEFHEFSDWLRVHGTIEEGPQNLGSHHTLNLEPGDAVAVVKTWKGHQLDRVRRAVEGTHEPLVTVVSLDYDEATVAQILHYGIRELANITSHASGKRHPPKGEKEAFYGDLLRTLRNAPRGEVLLIIGPGFAKDEFHSFGLEREPELLRAAQVHGTGHAGMAGIQEVLRGGISASILEDSRVAEETRLVEEVLRRIATGEPVAYGPDEVAEALSMGAVEGMLVADTLLRSARMDALMTQAEETKSSVTVVSALHEAGKKLESLGGVAAILRFPIST